MKTKALEEQSTSEIELVEYNLDDIDTLKKREIDFNRTRIPFLKFIDGFKLDPDKVIGLPPLPGDKPDIPLSSIKDVVNILFDRKSKDEDKRKTAESYYKNIEELYHLNSRYLEVLDKNKIDPDCYFMAYYRANKNIFKWLLTRLDRIKSIEGTVRKRIERNRKLYTEKKDLWLEFYESYAKNKNVFSKLIRIVATSALISTGILMTGRDQLISLLDKLTKGYGVLTYVFVAVGIGGLIKLSDMIVRGWIWSRIGMVKTYHHIRITLTDLYEAGWRRKLSNQTLHEAVFEFAKANYWQEVKEFIETNKELNQKQKDMALGCVNKKDLKGLSSYVEKSRKKAWKLYNELLFKIYDILS